MESHLNSIQRVSDSYLCSNCGACRVVCPRDAISFNRSSIGRLFANVSETCIDCGLCQKVCPSLIKKKDTPSNDEILGNISSLGVGKALNEEIYKNAQSGGICTALLKYLFDSRKIDGALVCRMDFGDPVPIVKATIIDNPEDLSTSQKSCYTPVELLGVLKSQIEKYSSIAVVGLGRHIEGLFGIQKLKKTFENKIFCKIGLICDRTLCGTIQDVYSSYAKKLDIVKINWRCKHFSHEKIDYTYKNAPLVIFNKDGRKKVFPNSYRFILKDMFTSPRCRICPDKLNIFSDITLGDPWGMSDIDWENGESVVIGRTAKGEEILSAAIEKGYISLTSRTLKELIDGQVIDKRRQQVLDYAYAFSVLKPQIQSPFLIKSAENHIAEDVDYAKRELLSFRELESLAKTEIVTIARKKISRLNKENSLAYRISRRILRIFKR